MRESVCVGPVQAVLCPSPCDRWDRVQLLCDSENDKWKKMDGWMEYSQSLACLFRHRRSIININITIQTV